MSRSPRQLHSSLLVTRRSLAGVCLDLAPQHLKVDSVADLHEAPEAAASSPTLDARVDGLAQRGDHGLIEC